jgi:hypothetical protein
MQKLQIDFDRPRTYGLGLSVLAANDSTGKPPPRESELVLFGQPPRIAVLSKKTE